MPSQGAASVKSQPSCFVAVLQPGPDKLVSRHASKADSLQK